MIRRPFVMITFLLLQPLTFAGELPKGDARAEGFIPETLEKIPGVLQEAVARKKIAGAATLVARHGKVVQVVTAGMADVEANRPMERSTIFRIASMSKPITSAARDDPGR